MSNINPNNINVNYPIAGQDQGSQGFRDNFASTANNFATAKAELNDLQAKVLLKQALNGTILNNDMAGAAIISATMTDMRLSVYQNQPVYGVSNSIVIDGANGSYQYTSLNSDTPYQLDVVLSPYQNTVSTILLEISSGANASIQFPSNTSSGITFVGLDAVPNVGYDVINGSSTMYIGDRSPSRAAGNAIVLSMTMRTESADFGTVVIQDMTDLQSRVLWGNVTQTPRRDPVSGVYVGQPGDRAGDLLVTAGNTNIASKIWFCTQNYNSQQANANLGIWSQVAGSELNLGPKLPGGSLQFANIFGNGEFQSSNTLVYLPGEYTNNIGNLTLGNVTNQAYANLNIYGNVNLLRRNTFNDGGNLYVNATANSSIFSSLIYTANVFANTGLYGNVNQANTSNTVYANLLSAQTANVAGTATIATISANNITATSNITASGLFATANVTATYVLGNGRFLSGLANSDTVYSNANVAAYLPTYTGNLVSLAGNVTTTANVQANYYLGNGSFLTGLPVQYSNANVASYLPVYTGNIQAGNISVTANISAGNISVSSNIQASYYLGNGRQLTGITRLANGTLPGVSSITTQISIPDAATGNIVANGTLNLGGNLNVINDSSWGGGNITANSLFIDNIINLTSTSNLRMGGGTNGYSLTTDGAGNLSWSNVSGGGGGVPAGGNFAIQYNSNGTFAGSQQFTYDPLGNGNLNLNSGNFIAPSIYTTSYFYGSYRLANGNSITSNTQANTILLSSADGNIYGNANLVWNNGLSLSGNASISANLQVGNVANIANLLVNGPANLNGPANIFSANIVNSTGNTGEWTRIGQGSIETTNEFIIYTTNSLSTTALLSSGNLTLSGNILANGAIGNITGGNLISTANTYATKFFGDYIINTQANTSNGSIANTAYYVGVQQLSADRLLTLPDSNTVPQGKVIIIQDESGNVDGANTANIILISATNSKINGNGSPNAASIDSPYYGGTFVARGNLGWFQISYT